MRKEARVVQALCAVIVIGIAFFASGPARGQDVSSQSLVYAAYDGEDSAANVFKQMKASQKETGERIESFAIVSKDAKGNVHVKDQRSRDTKVGAVLGAVIGAVGGPAGAAAGAAAGGSVGYLTGDAVGISKDMVEQMKTSLTPNSSALVMVLDDKWVQDVDKSLRQANARQVAAEKIAANAKKAQ